MSLATDSQTRKIRIQSNENKMYVNRNRTKFPNCIGMFPECKGITEAKDFCKVCPYFK